MKNFIKFILVGLGVVVAAEFQLGVIFRGDVIGYGITMLLYVVILSLAYGFLKFAHKKWPKAKADIYYFIILSIFGLLIEWFLLGTAPWLDNEANQFGMLAWWSALALVPRIFTDSTASEALKKRIKITLLVFSFGTLALVIPLHFMGQNTPAYIIFFFSWLITYLSLYFAYIPYLAKDEYIAKTKTFRNVSIIFFVLAGITQFIK